MKSPKLTCQVHFKKLNSFCRTHSVSYFYNSLGVQGSSGNSKDNNIWWGEETERKWERHTDQVLTKKNTTALNHGTCNRQAAWVHVCVCVWAHESISLYSLHWVQCTHEVMRVETPLISIKQLNSTKGAKKTNTLILVRWTNISLP